MEVALYARVSTERQQQVQTIQGQLERLRPYVSQHTDWHLALEFRLTTIDSARPSWC